jgi:hypothetical protein
MQIKFDPVDPPPSGVVSFLSWSHPELHAALRRAFDEGPREYIDRIDITRDGLRAHFEPRQCAVMPGRD